MRQYSLSLLKRKGKMKKNDVFFKNIEFLLKKPYILLNYFNDKE